MRGLQKSRPLDGRRYGRGLEWQVCLRRMTGQNWARESESTGKCSKAFDHELGGWSPNTFFFFSYFHTLVKAQPTGHNNVFFAQMITLRTQDKM